MSCPTTFEDINTNKAAKSKFIAEFEKNENKSHLLVFGLRGIGKKTMVRLFLKSISYTPLFLDVNPLFHSEEEFVKVLCGLENNPCNVAGKWICLVMTGFDAGFEFQQTLYQSVANKLRNSLKQIPVIIIVNIDKPADDDKCVSKLKTDLNLDGLFTYVEMTGLSRQELIVMVKAQLRASTKSFKPIIYNSSEIDEIVNKCDGSFANCIGVVRRHKRQTSNYNQLPIYDHSKEDAMMNHINNPDVHDWIKHRIQPKDWGSASLDDYERQSEIASMYDHNDGDEEEPVITPTQSLVKRIPRDVYLYYLKTTKLVDGLSRTVFIRDGALALFRKNIAKYGLTSEAAFELISPALPSLFYRYDKNQEKLQMAEKVRLSRQLDDGYKRELYIGRHVQLDAKETKKEVAVVKQPQQKPPSSKKRKLESGQVTLDSIFFDNKNKHKIV